MFECYYLINCFSLSARKLGSRLRDLRDGLGYDILDYARAFHCQTKIHKNGLSNSSMIMMGLNPSMYI
jgi:hypothetical protein